MTSPDAHLPPDDLGLIGQRAAAFIAARYQRHAAKRLQDDLDISDATANRLKRGDLTWPLFGRMVRAYGRSFSDLALAPLLAAETDPFQDRVNRDAALSDTSIAAGTRLAGKRADAAALRFRITDALGDCRNAHRDGDPLGADRGWRFRAGATAARAGAADLAPDGVGRFAGGATEARVLGNAEMAPAHRGLIRMIAETGGEFTPGAAAELGRCGLEGLSWLYRATVDLPVLHVGSDIRVISDADRRAILNRPIADQPLPPNFLRVVLGHLVDCLVPATMPTVHRVTARLGGADVVYDRLAAHWPRSGLVLSSCLMVTA